MALAATGVVIWDPSAGSNDNAGYFDASLAGAGTDYTAAQATPILALTDLACTAGSTTLTSATGGFTAAMVGNGIYIVSGTNFTAGLYVITGWTDTNTITLDRSPAPSSNGSSGVGNVAGRRAVFTDAFLELSVAGMTHRAWATATMTLTQNLSIAADGSASGVITIEGRSSTGAAEPAGDDRPLIAAGSYSLFGITPDYWIARDLRLTTEYSYGLCLGGYSTIERCKSTATGSSHHGLRVGNYSTIIGCEASGSGNYSAGIYVNAQYITIYQCYLHDCGASGVYAYNCNSLGFVECIIDTCVNGISLTAGYNNFYIVNNTIYGCTTGISGSGVAQVINNIIATCTTALSWNSQNYAAYYDYNDLYDCTTDRSNVAVGAHDFDADPLFTNAANGDFSRTETDADGLGITLGVG